jgi:hypothetical protein
MNNNTGLTTDELQKAEELLLKMRNDPRFDIEQKTHVLYLQRAVMDAKRRAELELNRGYIPNNNRNYSGYMYDK